MTYWALLILAIVLGAATQFYIHHAFNKYSRYETSAHMTGAQAARKMLEDNGIRDVDIRRISGNLTDNYDPRNHTLNLSESVYDKDTISAMAVACHECGHAVQHACGYMPLRVRTAIVPVANFGSRIWVFLLILGLIFNILALYWLAIICFGFSVLFQVVTLPVEFNASHRALAYVGGGSLAGGSVTDRERRGSRTVLRAAALTYVANALMSILYLLYYLNRAGSR